MLQVVDLVVHGFGGVHEEVDVCGLYLYLDVEWVDFCWVVVG